MKQILFVSILFLAGLTIQAMNLPVSAIPKTRSSGSLAGDKKRAKELLKITVYTREEYERDTQIITGLHIAAALRFTQNVTSLAKEFSESIQSMETKSENVKAQYIKLMKEFDLVALKPDSDQELHKLRDEMQSVEDTKPQSHHAHASKKKHKRGDSF